MEVLVGRQRVHQLGCTCARKAEDGGDEVRDARLHQEQRHPPRDQLQSGQVVCLLSRDLLGHRASCSLHFGDGFADGNNDLSNCPQYLHDFEERLDGLPFVGELLQQVSFHLRLTGDHGVLPPLVAQADLDGVEVLIQLLELQLALGELVEGDPQQTVLVELTDVVEPCGGKSGTGRGLSFLLQTPKL